ncbi:hypothetical protein J0X19_10895, partial [Hymenobacter sp. BT186]
MLAILADSLSLLEMAAKRKNPQTVVLDPVVAEEADVMDSVADAADEVAYDDGVASSCPTCGELLAWHEEACQAVSVPSPKPALATPEEATET